MLFAALALLFTVPALSQDHDATAGEFTFTPTEAWKKMKPTSRMVSAMYEHAETKTTLKIYYFGPGQGGGVEANLQRWRGQFEDEPKVKETLVKKDFDGNNVHLLQLDGTFLDGPPFGPKTPKKGSTMLGAILESDRGAVFLKTSGKAEVMTKLKEDFDALATSPYAKDEKEGEEEATEAEKPEAEEKKEEETEK